MSIKKDMTDHASTDSKCENSFWRWIVAKFCFCAPNSVSRTSGSSMETTTAWSKAGDQISQNGVENIENFLKIEREENNYENDLLFPPKILTEGGPNSNVIGDGPLHGRDSGFGEGDGQEVIAAMATRDCYERETVLKQIETAVSKIKKSHYLTAVLEKIGSTLVATMEKSKSSSSSSSLKKIERILCYELGSLSSTDNYNSVHQFAFLLSIQKVLKIPLEFCDPLFTPFDKSIITQNYDLTIIPWSDRIQRQKNVKELTLFYVPATTYGIINSILESNWKLQNLPNVMMITVSLRGITRDLREAPVGFFDPIDCTFIKRACNVAIERKLNVSSLRYNAAVSCFSVHTFPSSRLGGLDHIFWRVGDHGWREF